MQKFNIYTKNINVYFIIFFIIILVIIFFNKFIKFKELFSNNTKTLYKNFSPCNPKKKDYSEWGGKCIKTENACFKYNGGWIPSQFKCSLNSSDCTAHKNTEMKDNRCQLISSIKKKEHIEEEKKLKEKCLHQGKQWYNNKCITLAQKCKEENKFMINYNGKQKCVTSQQGEALCRHNNKSWINNACFSKKIACTINGKIWVWGLGEGFGCKTPTEYCQSKGGVMHDGHCIPKNIYDCLNKGPGFQWKDNKCQEVQYAWCGENGDRCDSNCNGDPCASGGKRGGDCHDGCVCEMDGGPNPPPGRYWRGFCLKKGCHNTWCKIGEGIKGFGNKIQGAFAGGYQSLGAVGGWGYMGKDDGIAQEQQQQMKKIYDTAKNMAVADAMAIKNVGSDFGNLVKHCIDPFSYLEPARVKYCKKERSKFGNQIIVTAGDDGSLLIGGAAGYGLEAAATATDSARAQAATCNASIAKCKSYGGTHHGCKCSNGTCRIICKP
jgi:hypothetical protein